MEKILELLKAELAKQKENTGCFTEVEASFKDGIEMGLENAIDVVEAEILKAKTVSNSSLDTTKTKCTCTDTIRFKTMNFFKNLTYNFKVNIDAVSVSYEDGRFTTMSKEDFLNHFTI